MIYFMKIYELQLQYMQIYLSIEQVNVSFKIFR